MDENNNQNQPSDQEQDDTLKTIPSSATDIEKKTELSFFLGFPGLLVLLLIVQFYSSFPLDEFRKYLISSYLIAPSPFLLMIIRDLILYIGAIILAIKTYKKNHRNFVIGSVISIAIAILLTTACYTILATHDSNFYKPSVTYSST